MDLTPTHSPSISNSTFKWGDFHLHRFLPLFRIQLLRVSNKKNKPCHVPKLIAIRALIANLLVANNSLLSFFFFLGGVDQITNISSSDISIGKKKEILEPQIDRIIWYWNKNLIKKNYFSIQTHFPMPCHEITETLPVARFRKMNTYINNIRYIYPSLSTCICFFFKNENLLNYNLFKWVILKGKKYNLLYISLYVPRFLKG